MSLVYKYLTNHMPDIHSLVQVSAYTPEIYVDTLRTSQNGKHYADRMEWFQFDLNFFNICLELYCTEVPQAPLECPNLINMAGCSSQQFPSTWFPAANRIAGAGDLLMVWPDCISLYNHAGPMNSQNKVMKKNAVNGI